MEIIVSWVAGISVFMKHAGLHSSCSVFLILFCLWCCLQRGETALHMASRAGQTEVVRHLVQNGAQVEAKAKVRRWQVWHSWMICTGQSITFILCVSFRMGKRWSQAFVMPTDTDVPSHYSHQWSISEKQGRCLADTIPVFNTNNHVFEGFCLKVGLKEGEEVLKSEFISAELESPGLWCLLWCP